MTVIFLEQLAVAWVFNVTVDNTVISKQASWGKQLIWEVIDEQ